MGLAVARSRVLRGLSALPVRVETHLSNGLPAFAIVGLPQATVRESRDRVRAAIIESGYDFPNRRITVNLAPAELPKESSRFDLPIAVAILCAAGRLPTGVLERVELAGELSLSGALRSIPGGLAIASGLARDGSQRALIVPVETAVEARLGQSGIVLAAENLSQVCELLEALAAGTPAAALAESKCHDGGLMVSASSAPWGIAAGTTFDPKLDLDDVVDQPVAKRALEVCAAGEHHLLMTGPPGTGKSMLAQRLQGLLPDLTPEHALEKAMIASLRRLPVSGIDARPAWRAPHHSTSAVGLIGGGHPPAPGEISLAHRGVLFLDELPEFRRQAIEALREPLESGRITLSRGQFQQDFPAAFVLVAAMNPCPCGYLGDPHHACFCSTEQIRRYRTRLSGPLLDRFDLSIEVKRPRALTVPAELVPPVRGRAAGAPIEAADQGTRHGIADGSGFSSNLSGSTIARARVAKARARQFTRQGCVNSRLDPGRLAQRLAIDAAAVRLGEQAMSRFGWSLRALHRTFKVARTITDLEDAKTVNADAVAEAIALRHVRSD